MQPIFGRNDFLQSAAPKDILNAQRDESCVLTIMIKGVTASDALDHQPVGLQVGDVVYVSPRKVQVFVQDYSI